MDSQPLTGNNMNKQKHNAERKVPRQDSVCQVDNIKKIMTANDASDLIVAYSVTSFEVFTAILDKAKIRPRQLSHRKAVAHLDAFLELKNIDGIDFYIPQYWCKVRKKLNYTDQDYRDDYLSHCVDKCKANKFELVKAINIITNKQRK